jgi:hypothetical protein
MADDAPLTPDAQFPLEDLPPTGAKPPSMPRSVLAMGGLFLLLGAVLRFAQVGWREAFGGEITTLGLLGVAGLPKPTSLGEAILAGRMPLYDWLMAGYGALVGTESLTLLRIPSAILGILSCIAFLVLAGKYMRGTAFTIAAMLYCLNPVLIRASNDATPHALLAFVGVMAHLLCIRALDEGETRRWVRYGVACVLGILIHPCFLGLIAGHFAFAFICRRRVPASFLRFALVGSVVLALSSLVLGILALRARGQSWELALPVDDAMANLVALQFGDFRRYPTNFFFQSVLYLTLIGGLVLAGLYHYRRKTEAELLPENVGFIDQTQDVVGTWRRLSLETFLTLNWCALGGVFLGVLAAGVISDQFPVQPASLLAALSPLCLLLAVGLDALPNLRVRIAAAVYLLVIGGWFTFHGLNDRGYGVNQAARIIRGMNFDPANDKVVFVDRTPLAGAVAYHLGDLRPEGIHASDTPSGVETDAGNIRTLLRSVRRVFVIYYKDRRTVAKQLRSPVREYLGDRKGPWEEIEKWENLSRYEDTELRVYQRR